MNESGFIRALHKRLPSKIYCWKISDRFSAGVADAYYSSDKTDLWVEYKFYPKGLPAKTKPKLSKLQIKWLEERHNEGRNVYVIVGSPDKCLLFSNKEWTTHKPLTAAVSRDEIINWFTGQLC